VLQRSLLLLLALAASAAFASACESQSLASDRALLDAVDASLAGLIPGGDCAQLDAVLVAADRAAAELDGKVRSRPVLAFADMVRTLRAECAPVTAKAKDALATTWNNLRVTVGRGAETLSGGVRSNAPIP